MSDLINLQKKRISKLEEQLKEETSKLQQLESYKDNDKTISICRTDADAKRRGLQGKAVFSLREIISFIPEQILDIRASFTTSDIENVKSKVDEPFDDPIPF